MNESWIDKRDCQKSFKIKTTTKRFADILEGSNMLIASPPIINDYVKSLPYGKFVEPSTMRENLAKKYKFKRKDFPISEKFYQSVFSIPIYYKLQIKEQKKIVNLLNNII